MSNNKRIGMVFLHVSDKGYHIQGVHTKIDQARWNEAREEEDSPFDFLGLSIINNFIDDYDNGNDTLMLAIREDDDDGFHVVSWGNDPIALNISQAIHEACHTIPFHNLPKMLNGMVTQLQEHDNPRLILSAV